MTGLLSFIRTAGRQRSVVPKVIDSLPTGVMRSKAFFRDFGITVINYNINLGKTDIIVPVIVVRIQEEGIGNTSAILKVGRLKVLYLVRGR